MTLLEIEGLSMTAGTGSAARRLLDEVSFAISPGTITGVAGASGSGKTMTGLSVMGLVPDGTHITGSIRFDDRELVGLGNREYNGLRGAKLAMIFQDPAASLHPMLSIGRQMTDHLRFHTGISRSQARSRAAEALERTRVPDPVGALKKYPHQFSGGQLQRIAVASAIVCEPRILIADEPTTALDVTVQAGVLRLLRELCDDLDLGVLLVTHDFGVLSSIADDIVVMQNGVVVERGPREATITAPQHAYTRSLIESLPGSEVLR
ncbi:ATP-binding cassette domain-containing protein [Brevibacterium sp. 5221]|uniref:ATP-binding cassette domain-containing protein n=1 Tax=Brevibacterium rongguiense TaxID=2695267 RepID=A0A6N9H447_9MICO|nr:MULTISPECIES: ABC transporter ATP-binding protein [Brevibacterium]MYM18601.1 ATP-binding cassette domain-containing protein [Brevibacterium rongguiense]WAL41374.1 ABC transporter ATP-binding protein [Brevibacterium sp. BRM-1]